MAQYTTQTKPEVVIQANYLVTGYFWNRGTGLVFQFDLGQIGTLTPSPCSKVKLEH
ncbi:MAG: hypothetical protein FWE41_05895 [Coriobacteriia bacterium]|nr:hypothetical protein [Coriobacteriia bacterium]MCL2749954.1 hypothetical protein [Coriobacteriia bacterium]